MRRASALWEVFVLRFEEALERYRKRRLTADEAGEVLGMSGRNFRRLIMRYELRPDGAGTLLTITERGFVKNVIFRALARYVFTHHRTLEQYLRTLGRRFGVEVKPEPA